jgi:hypothetical protein
MVRRSQGHCSNIDRRAGRKGNRRYCSNIDRCAGRKGNGF